MENYRRGGGDRMTEDRSDYGRRHSERNFSENRNSRYSAEAPKRRPRVIRGKDGELRSAPAAPAYGGRFSREHSSDGDRRSCNSGYERRSGASFERRRPAGHGRFPERGPQQEGHRGPGFGRPGSGRPAAGRPYAGRPSSGRPDRAFGQQRKPKTPAAESGINRMISRKQFAQNDMFSDNDMVNIPVKEEVRLNKFIANSGVCSRREADNYIQAGVVTVNGEVVTRTELDSIVVKEPVTQVTTVGTAISTASPAQRSEERSAGFICPLKRGSFVITSYYGDGRNHKGMDLGADKGTPIYAAAAGTVISSGYEGDYGYSVVIDHGNGYKTRYAHASALCVKKGQTVSQGDVVAYVGSTGYSTGNHLHFEIIKNGSRVNPVSYIGLD